MSMSPSLRTRSLSWPPILLLAAGAMPAHAQTELCIGSTSALYQAIADIDGSQTGPITLKLQSGTYALGSDLVLKYREYGDPSGSYGHLTIRGGYNASCTAISNALGATTLTGSGGQRAVDIELINNGFTLDRISSSNIDWNFGNWICYSAQDRPLNLHSVRLTNTYVSFDLMSCYDMLIQNSLITARAGTPNDTLVRYGAYFSSSSHPPFFSISNSTLRGGGLRADFIADPPISAAVQLFGTVFENDGVEVAIDGAHLYASHNRYDSLSLTNGSLATDLDNIQAAPLLQSSGVPQNDSPLVNAGTRFVPGGLPARDLAGNPRHVGSDPDIGAFETAVDNSLYLDVTNTNASGAGSLAQAAASANATNGRQVIRFDIGGACPRTITLSQTITLTDETDILGETQPGTQANTFATGYNGEPCVILRAGSGVENGLVFDSDEAADDLKLNQVAFSGFEGDAVALRSGAGHLLTGNQFGGTIGSATLLDVGTAIRIEDAAGDAQIGGADAAQTNLVGSAIFGIVLEGSGGNRVLGNAIGETGVQALPNAIGVAIRSDGNVIDDNLIFHSTGINVLLSGEQAHHNSVRDNGIGGAGVHGLNIVGGAHRNRIGPGNYFTGNDSDGIYVASGSFNDLSGNRYSGNDGLAIDLAGNGVTPNDPDPVIDGNLTPNRNQNFPVLILAEPASSFGLHYLRVEGTLSSTLGSYRVDVYRNTSCDPSGHGEGVGLLGTLDVELDCTIVGPNQQCTRSFDGLVFGQVQPGQQITAIATSPGGHTSEFSACIEAGSDVIFADDFED